MFLQRLVQPTMSAQLRCASNNSKNGVGGGLLGKNINFTFLTGEDVDLWCYCFDRDFRHTIYDYICLFHFKVYLILSAAMVCLLNINTRIHEMNQ